MKKPLGRRAGSTGESRDAILRAARDLFAERGFRGATTRAIAERAGVDIALIAYFFASKERLFASAIELPVSADQLRDLVSEGPPGERLTRFHLEHLFVERREAITALLRAALGDPDCIPALRALIQDHLVAGAARGLTGPDARLRSTIAGALMVGLFICRDMVGVEPLASASVDRLVAHIAPFLDGVLARKR